MISKPIKKIINLNKKTQRNYKMSKSRMLSSSACDKSANTYNTFEDKAEELFKKNKIDLVSTSFNLEKEIVKDLKSAVSPSGIQPNDDFYSYINERWIADYELSEQQKYIVQVDDFRIVQDKVYRELIQIIEEYISNPSTKNSKKAKCIKDAYVSFKTQNTNKQITHQAKETLNYIDSLRENTLAIKEQTSYRTSPQPQQPTPQAEVKYEPQASSEYTDNISDVVQEEVYEKKKMVKTKNKLKTTLEEQIEFFEPEEVENGVYSVLNDNGGFKTESKLADNMPAFGDPDVLAGIEKIAKESGLEKPVRKKTTTTKRTTTPRKPRK